MASLTRFSRRMRELGQQVETGSNLLVRRTALAVDRELVFGTPVDTGRARSNWQVGLDAPETSELPPYSPSSGAGIGETANARATLAQNRAEIERRRTGQDIFLSNNLPYIRRLNDGWSAQAPAGFVERAVEAGRTVVRNGKVLRK